MKTFEYIIGIIFLIIGIFSVFAGMISSAEQGISSISIVLGGGIFMAFAVAILLKYKD